MNMQFKAYELRRKAVHNKILLLGKEIAEKGYRVITIPCLRITFAVVIDDVNCAMTTFGFSECPYRWYIDGKEKIVFPLLAGERSYDIPFSSDEVISNLARYKPTKNRYSVYEPVSKIDPIE